MNIVLNIADIDEKSIYFTDAKANTHLPNSTFNRITYSTDDFIMSGIYVYFELYIKNIENNYTILGEVDHEFHPQGCSFIFLLSESHLSVHTFPEKNHLAFDLYTCRQYESNNVYIEIYLKLCEKLGTSCQQSDYNIIDRYFQHNPPFENPPFENPPFENPPFEKVEPNLFDILENDPLGFHL
jgi:S-adenosylmethionine decarboxylase